MKAKAKSTMTSYFGLEVKVILKMEALSLILYRNRKFVVDTADLRPAELLVWDCWGSSSHALAQAS
jgi:hypothetical protein